MRGRGGETRRSSTSGPFGPRRETSWNHADVAAVAEAGGYARYARAHCERLAAIFMPKPETGKGRRRSKRRRSPLHGLPPELVRRVVEYWAHAGYY